MSRTSEHTSRAAQVEVELPGFTLAALRTGGETIRRSCWCRAGRAARRTSARFSSRSVRPVTWSPRSTSGDSSAPRSVRTATTHRLRSETTSAGRRPRSAGVSICSGTRSADWSRELRCLLTPDLFRSLVLLDSGPAGVDDGRRERLDLMRPPVLPPIWAGGGLPGLGSARRERAPGTSHRSRREARFMAKGSWRATPRPLLEWRRR